MRSFSFRERSWRGRALFPAPVRPSALAFVRLMTRSNLVGCATGMSAGFAPRRILSPNSGTSVSGRENENKFSRNAERKTNYCVFLLSA